MLRKPVRRYIVLIFSIVFSITAPCAVFAQTKLENPQPGSFQSGIGIVSGWACTADRIDIEVSGNDVTATLQAAYGTARGDTATICGDTDNGFGLLVNWNLLHDGNYTVRALRNGEEFARVTVIVGTLGLNQQFATGLTGESQLPNFPQNGKTTRIRWQESIQNFSIVGATESPAAGTPSSPGTKLENPLSGSFQSGVSVISGWACDANRIDIEVDGSITLQAAYGTGRSDTASACGDTDNGFGLLVNWSDLPDGVHTLRALKDGVEFAHSTFTVTTLGLGSFARGLSGGFVVSNFPQSGRHTRVQWQESTQNFAITGAITPEIDEAACTTAIQSATDAAGGKASIAATNPCQSRGQIQVAQVRPQSSTALRVGNSPETRAASTDEFFACDTNLTLTQGGKTFTTSDFDWLDSNGNRVCGTLTSGSTLDTFIIIKDGSSLNFNQPFNIVYNNQRVFQWASAFLPAPTIVDNRATDEGPPIGCSLFGVPSTLQFCNGDTPVGTRFITLTSQCSVFLEGETTLIVDNNDFHIAAGESFFLQPPSGGALIAIQYTGKCPATSRGRAEISLEGTGVAVVLLNPVE